MNVKHLLILISLLFSSSVYGQIAYSYTDPCTGDLKTINVPSNGITVTYYGQVNTFQSTDFYNGNFETWAQGVYGSFGGNNPCASIVGLPTSINIAQSASLNFVSIINSLDAIQSFGGGSTNMLSGVNSASNASNSEKKGNSKGKNSNASNTNNNDPAQNNSSGSSPNNSQQNNSTSQTGGSGNSQNQTSTNTGSSTESGGQSSQTTGQSTSGGNSQTTTSEIKSSSSTSQTAGQSGESGSSSGNQSTGSSNEQSNNQTVGATTGSTGSEGSQTAGQPTESGTTGSTQTNETSASGSQGNNQGGSSNGSQGNETTNANEQTDPDKTEGGGKTNIVGSSVTSAQNSTNKNGNRPSVIASSDFVGFNFKNSDVSYGGKFTGGYTALRWDGARSYGFLIDYTTAIKGPNISGFYAFIHKRRIDLISTAVTIGFDQRMSIYGTFTAGQMWNLGKDKKAKALYMLTASAGSVYGAPFIGTAAIAGTMYDMKIGKRIEVKLMGLYVYAPYVSYYNDILLKSPHVVLPILGTNIGITKKFKLNINGGGAWAIKENALNYTVMMGTRFLL